MKNVTYRLCLLASAMFAVAVADAQQSGGDAGSGAGTGTSSADPSSSQTGSAGVPGTAGAQGSFQAGQQQSGIGAGQNQFNQPGAPREPAGQRLQPQNPGIQTRQNIVAPSNRFGQQRGLNFQSGAADPLPTPAERQAQGFGAELQTNGQRGQYGASAEGQRGQYGATGQGQQGQGQRGELGVWLAASGGQGVQIRRVTGGSAAEEIGLRPGDMILQINGQSVMSPTEVQRLIRAIPAGQTAMLEVWRDGAQQEVSVTLQPMRESYRSGYRGEEMGYGSEMRESSGDLDSRTMQLEKQLNMMMRELQQIRAEMARIPSASSGQAAGAGFGNEQGGAQSQTTEFDAIGTQSEPNEFDQPATQPEPSATEPEPSATEPEPAPTETTPAEPSAAGPTDDLFGSDPAEPDAEATPAEETETESHTDLFQ